MFGKQKVVDAEKKQVWKKRCARKCSMNVRQNMANCDVGLMVKLGDKCSMPKSSQINETVDSKPLHSKCGETVGAARGFTHTGSFSAKALMGRTIRSGEDDSTDEALRDASSTD